jgi:hypothetical protein
MIFTKAGSVASLSISDHRELAPGTLRKLIRAAGVTVEEFRARVRQQLTPHRPPRPPRIRCPFSIEYGSADGSPLASRSDVRVHLW